MTVKKLSKKSAEGGVSETPPDRALQELAGELAVPQAVAAPGIKVEALPLPKVEHEHVSKAPCSVEFSRNAKGEPSWTIKLYGERDQMQAVLDEALALDQAIRARASGRQV